MVFVLIIILFQHKRNRYVLQAMVVLKENNQEVLMFLNICYKKLEAYMYNTFIKYDVYN